MTDPVILVVVAATFLLAGAVKGVIGLGLPTISLALLTVALDLHSAMALLLIPSFVTNFWQGSVGGKAIAIFRRLWPFMLMATVTVWVGALALRHVDLAALSALLGTLLVAYAGLSLVGYSMVLSPRQERWAGPLAGLVNGVLTGMTGSFVVPGVMFLQAIGLPRDMLVQAMGVLFTVSTLALGVALGGNGLLTAELGSLSAAAIVPAVAGMILGRKIRKRLAEQMFRRVFFVSLLLLGGYIIVTSAGRLS